MRVLINSLYLPWFSFKAKYIFPGQAGMLKEVMLKLKIRHNSNVLEQKQILQLHFSQKLTGNQIGATQC